MAFEKGEDKNTIKLQCADFLHDFGSNIQKMELYYNPYTTVVEGVARDMKQYDIRTQKEVD